MFEGALDVVTLGQEQWSMKQRGALRAYRGFGPWHPNILLVRGQAN
jgi:hypothetical protein